jgi:hypothetical protein
MHANFNPDLHSRMSLKQVAVPRLKLTPKLKPNSTKMSLWFTSPSVALVFVHGFMGSSKSFLDFPNDLKGQFKDSVVLHFEYETQGSAA